jgi:hypothetical protein
MARFSEETADSIGKAPPDCTLISQSGAATPRQRINSAPPSRLRRRPPAAEQTRLFEAVECRVNRSFGQIERTAAAAADLLDDSVAMRRAARECGEHDHVEVTFEHFSFHALKLRLAMLGVNWQPTQLIPDLIVSPPARRITCAGRLPCRELPNRAVGEAIGSGRPPR